MLSRACGDAILPLVLPFITDSLTDSGKLMSAPTGGRNRQIAAGLAVLAAVMEGPTAAALLPLVHGLVDLLESFLACQTSTQVGTNTGLSTIHQSTS